MIAKKITVDQIMSWYPCPEYDRARVKKLIGAGKGKTPLEILALKIPPADRLWCLCQEDALPPFVQWLFGASCAERALRLERAAGREPDPRSWAAVRVARRHARGKATDEELQAAWAAARAPELEAVWAARAAARSASWAVVGAAARAAAWVAAGAAALVAAEEAWAVARPAARRAAWAAAREAERRWQVQQLRRIIRREMQRESEPHGGGE